MVNMLEIHIVILITLFSCLTSALWPAPNSFRNGSDVLWISTELSFTYHAKSKSTVRSYWSSLQQALGFDKGLHVGHVDVSSSRNFLEAAFNRTRLSYDQSIVPRKFHRERIPFEPAIDAQRDYVHGITINQVDKLFNINGQEMISEDGYILKLEKDGHVIIDIKNRRGGIYALETFTQLFYRHSGDNEAAYTPFAPFHIIDEPAFQHRGINLDISRNSLSPADVMRQIPAMAACKLNRLRLHASDAQSWPLEIPSFLELARKGAYDESQIWSVEDLEKVQRLGTQHGVEVYLEIDLPGHSTSVSRAFPEHITAANMQPWDPWALEPPSGQLRLNSSDTLAFVHTVLNDLLSRVTRHTFLFHIGGDELNKAAYGIDPSVNSSDERILKPLLQSFMSNASKTVASHGATPVVWEDMLLQWNLTLPPSTIVQTWVKPDSLAAVVSKGYRALFGSNTHWYLDCGHGTFLDPNTTNPNSPIKSPYADWCSPYKSWRQVYSYNPMDGILDQYRHLVLGGEVNLFGELTDSVTLDGMLWPRAAAAAEVMWSGSGREVNEDATRRLAEFRERLVVRGLNAGMVQMEWCLRNQGCCTL